MTVVKRMERPWGTWEVLDDSVLGHKVKRLTINPGQAISRQFHEHRDETWVIVSGMGYVELGDPPATDVIPVRKTDCITIFKGQIHKVYAFGNEPLVAVEVQIGEITEEEDITRLD